jgi:hypothetical protein
VLRLVAAGVATMAEIRSSWSIRQVFDMYEYLELKDEVELNAAEARQESMER